VHCLRYLAARLEAVGAFFAILFETLLTPSVGTADPLYAIGLPNPLVAKYFLNSTGGNAGDSL
jgi:hypothetical protein